MTVGKVIPRLVLVLIPKAILRNARKVTTSSTEFPSAVVAVWKS